MRALIFYFYFGKPESVRAAESDVSIARFNLKLFPLHPPELDLTCVLLEIVSLG